jgi:hypothetical protein
MGSTLKVRVPVTRTLIDKIKADLKMRAEMKAKRMLLKEPKRKPKRGKVEEIKPHRDGERYGGGD